MAFETLADRLASRILLCPDAGEWLAQYNPDEADRAWRECPRADWLFYVLSKGVEQGSPEHRKLVMVMCECIRPVLQLISIDEDRPRLAIEAAEAWATGVMSEPEVRSFAEASAFANTATPFVGVAAAKVALATNIDDIAHAPALLDAADAFAVLANTQACDAHDPHDEAFGDYASAYAYALAGDVTASDSAHHRMARTIRRHYPSPPFRLMASP